MTEKRDSDNQSRKLNYAPLLRGIIEHVRDGRMSGEEFGLFSWLIVNAQPYTGVYYGNAELIRVELRKKLPIVKRTLLSLTRPRRGVPDGYIHYDGGRGYGGGSYPILVLKYPKAKGGKTSKGDYPKAEAQD